MSIYVSSKITLNMPLINSLSRNVAEALVQTAVALQSEVSQAMVVPRKDGALGDEKFFVDDSKANLGSVPLVHEGPYARRLYFHPEYNFHRDLWYDSQGKQHGGHPNAKGKWFEDWLKGGQYEDFCPKMFAKIYKELCGL